MKKIRIGNDIACVWTVCRNGQPEDFSNKNLQLYLLNQYGVKVDMDFTFDEGGKIKFTFYGKDQTTTGAYRCILVENKGEEGMNTVDSCDAFTLVSRGDVTCCSDIYEGTLELCSNIVSGLKGEKGDSAYQVWLSEGNEGTEGDFLASLKGERGDDGQDGKSVYELWLEQGNEGTEADFLNTIHGVAGKIVSVEAEGLEAGAEPTVKNEGTEENAKFVFGIPKGDTGEKGDTGKDGNGVYYTENEYDTNQDVQIGIASVNTFGKPLQVGDFVIEASANKRMFRVVAITDGDAEAVAETPETETAETETAVAGCEYIGMLRGERGEKGERGATGERGEKGDPFMIYNTYPSKEAMEADHGNEDVPLFGMVLIDTGDVEDEDNAKLYMKDEAGFVYLTDLSGAQGIKGDRGFSFRVGVVASVSDGAAVFGSVTPVEGLQAGDIIVGFNAEMGYYGQLFRITDAAQMKATDLGVSLRGAQGEKGEKGEQGEKGEKGEQGERGLQGEQGLQGEKGDAGEQGEQGPQGEVGPQGPQGEKGDKGDTGEQGPQGEKGDKGDTGEAGPVGPQGPQGEPGPQGPAGSGADITVDDELSEESENPVQNKVVTEALSEKAPIESPSFEGTPTAPTPVKEDNSKKIATTEFVNNRISDIGLSEAEYSYGVYHDYAVSAPECTRIGNMDLHKTLPIHSLVRGCLLNDNGDVVKYLDPDDWSDEVRDGSQGQVMMEIPAHYRRFNYTDSRWEVRLSEKALAGYHPVPKMYISAYEAALDRDNLMLASVVNDTARYRGGNNNASLDGTPDSLLGRPVSNINLTDFRTYARKRKAGSSQWNCYTYEAHKALFWLFVVEYATLNSQADYTPELTAEGYRQGGLGCMDMDYELNDYNPIIPCGYTDFLGNGTGIAEYEFPENYGTAIVSRYRGIENPFGHIWKWTDGILIKNAEVFTSNLPNDFSSVSVDNYNLVGNAKSGSGYIKKIIGGEYGEMIATETGGSSNTYFCDYHFYSKVSALRGVLFGGCARLGAYAGFVYAHAVYAPSYAAAYVGSRLCFHP